MKKTLPEVISDILNHNGAIVGQSDNGYLEIIVPREVSEILSIPEYARLRFSYNETCDEAIYASYDSDFFSSVAKLLRGSGRFSIARFETSIPNMEKLSKVISEKITLNNAIFRLDKTEFKDISYLLLYFKYVALSDEKHEGILPVLINQTNLCTLSLKNDINELMERLKEIDSDQQSPHPTNNPLLPPLRKGGVKGFEKGEQGGITVLQAAYSAATHIVQERLKDFVKSLERRLNRDIKRVYEYYETLKNETKTTIERKGDGIEKLLNKLDAIEAEWKWKVQDLIAKYALSIHVEPVAVINIETQAPVFWINIKRRLVTRQFPFTYNPIVRQFDALPCEACFSPEEGYYICDDKLHIVCGKCFKACPHCGRQYCKACHKDICPKCKSVF